MGGAPFQNGPRNCCEIGNKMENGKWDVENPNLAKTQSCRNTSVLAFAWSPVASSAARR
jgi:hypothetical protein